MLTASNVSSEMAVNYFVKNYYHQGKTRWAGKGAVELGLSGEIDNEKKFTNVIEGRSPNGKQQLNARILKSDQRRAALDCTFSAPKSVSLMALVGEDNRLIAAHHKALEKVIELMESRYAITRVTQGESRYRVSTGNLVIAQFDHIESRELDPHLHTHCLVMNTTQTKDGRWMSLVNGEIFANKKFLGMAYQSYLAVEVQELGYEIEPKKNGQFEIKGFKEQDLEAFSKRRQQIIEKTGISSSWAEREKTWDSTRQRKQKLTETELKSEWQDKAKKLGIQFSIPSEKVNVASTNALDSKNVLEDAIAHCSERNVAFKLEDLEKFILSEKLLTNINEIEPLVKKHEDLIVLPGVEREYTTWAAVKRELATINLMESGQDRAIPIQSKNIIESHLEQSSLNTGQKEAVILAVTTTDKIIAWQGVAGAGKTFALKELKAIALEQGYAIKGFAPSSMAAKVLSEEIGIQSETIASLLVSEPTEEKDEKQIWIVDEAGLLSAKDAHNLLQRASAERARVLLVGDTKQLSAVEAGNPFKSLQQAGMKTAYLNQSNRQRNTELKVAIDLIANGKIESGFEQLDRIGSIHEVSPVEKAEAIADEYIALTKEQRQNTLVLAGTNLERMEIVVAIREKLKVEGGLGAIASVTQLKAKNHLTKVQLTYTHNIEVGEVVIPSRNYKRRGLERGKTYEVVGKSLDKLILKGDNGKLLEVDTSFEKAVYEKNEIEIAVGDRLQWKRNDHQLERRNGQEFVVRTINGDFAEIQYVNSDRTETINLRQAQILDYSIVNTIYSSQGKTTDLALIAADYTIGKESFYVAASRARHNVKLYTTDKVRLLELAQQSKTKENALELLKKEIKEMAKESSPNLDPRSKQTTVPILPEAGMKPFNTSTIERPILKLPVPVKPFWAPQGGEAANFIELSHWQEFESSAIHPEIAALNFESLRFNYTGGEHEAWERLMVSEKLSRTNSGRLTEGLIKAYSHLDGDGWWCDAGVDPRTFSELMPGDKPTLKRWGCYKPNTPRPKKNEVGQIIEGKFIKYEHPPKVELSIFLLDIPKSIAEQIYSKYKVNPTNEEQKSGFWYCVWKHNIPCTITEGAKKAASLLSQGHAAIGLPGISAGYRSPKDEFGVRIGKTYLHEELAVFATPRREISFCFDYETKPETKINIERDISVTGRLLQEVGSRVKVVSLPGTEKGVDDFIAANGPLAYEKINHEAKRLSVWQRDNKKERVIVPPRKKEKTRKEVRSPLKISVKNLIYQLDKQRLTDLFIEIGKYAQGESVKGEEVGRLFTSTEETLTLEQKMSMVRELIREEKHNLMSLLEANQETKKSRIKIKL